MSLYIYDSFLMINCSPSVNDPSPMVALQQGLNLKTILDKAKPINHKSIVTFSQLRQEIFSELSHVEQVAGIKVLTNCTRSNDDYIYLFI